jgi:hypothetical protein
MIPSPLSFIAALIVKFTTAGTEKAEKNIDLLRIFIDYYFLLCVCGACGVELVTLLAFNRKLI